MQIKSIFWFDLQLGHLMHKTISLNFKILLNLIPLFKGDPKTPILLQTSFFEMPKMSDVEWTQFISGIKNNPTPVLWTAFFLVLLFLGFKISSDAERQSPQVFILQVETE